MKDNLKELKDYTLLDVREVVNTAIRTRKTIYFSLEDRYTDNARMFLEESKEHSGGGRITFGYICHINGPCFIESFYDRAEEIYTKEEFIKRLYDYIKDIY